MADNEATIELIQARRFIEVGAAKLAAKNATKDQIRKLGALVEDMAKIWEAGEDSAYADYTERNIAFHLLIAKAFHNRSMVHLMATIRGFMEQWAQESISVLAGLMDRSAKSHREIWDSIRDRDNRKAARLMRKHISDFQKSLERYYKIAGKGSSVSR